MRHYRLVNREAGLLLTIVNPELHLLLTALIREALHDAHDAVHEVDTRRHMAPIFHEPREGFVKQVLGLGIA